MRQAFLALSILTLAGCASSLAPSHQELAQADYGLYPAKYHSSIQSYLHTTLRDPASAMLSMPPAPVKTYAGVGKPKYGWGTCMGVNAKNGFGGYTGTKIYFFLFRDGQIIMTERTEGSTNSYNDDYVRDLCKRLI